VRLKGRYLYRGVSLAMFEAQQGRLLPKGSATQASFHYDGDITYGDGATHGPSLANAVIGHQKCSESHPDALLSFTTDFEVAVRYATAEHTRKGVVFVVDRDLLEPHGVREAIVTDYAHDPKKPDAEVLLHCLHSVELPQDIIVDRIEVFPK